MSKPNTFGLELDCVYIGLSDQMFQWQCTLKRGERTYKGRYFAGLAHTKNGVPTPPSLESYLYCLQSDARWGEHLLFEDFCDEFGYDSDSRKAESIWRACQQTRGELQNFLGADFEEFLSTDYE